MCSTMTYLGEIWGNWDRVQVSMASPGLMTNPEMSISSFVDYSNIT